MNRRPSIFALVVTIVLLLPLVVVIGMSFNPGSFIIFPPEGFSLQWFSSALSNPGFMAALGLSLQIALVAMAIGLVVSVPSALAIVRTAPRVRRLVQTAVLGPLIVPEVLLGLGMLITFNTVFGVGSVGFWSIVVGHVLVGMPLATQVLVAGLAGTSEVLERAAWTLGASRARAFLSVTLPQVAPSLVSAALFLFIFSFDNVSISLFLSKPGQTTLPIYLYQYIEYSADPTVAAMSTLLIVIGLVVAVLLGRVGGLTQIAGGRTRR
jgi:putative spermidine/putrescine transport system permease protein